MIMRTAAITGISVQLTTSLAMKNFFAFSTETENGYDYVVCIPERAKIEEECPITSIAFELDSDAGDKATHEEMV